MPIRPETDDIIRFLDEIAKADPVFMGALVSARVPCNAEILNHPTIQAGLARDYKNAKHAHNKPAGVDGMSDDQGICGFLGLLNGYCGSYDEGPRKGWGPITVVMEDDGRVTRIYRTPEE